MSDQKTTISDAGGPWFLRRSDDEIRGPISPETLREWVESAEITAGQVISVDCKEWQPVETHPELDMTWYAEVKDGSEYGPFNILAASRLVEKGILESDSVIRRREQEALSDTAAEKDVDEDPAVQNRIGNLEEELVQLREQLKDITAREAEPEAMRALTDTTHDSSAEAADLAAPGVNLEASGKTAEPNTDDFDVGIAHRSPHAHQEWRLGTALYARPEKRHREETGPFLIEDPNRLQSMARTRRFRAHALRWNAIAASLVLGTGVTVGALGYMLELIPMQFSGVIIALAGVAYLVISSLALMVGYLASKTAMHISTPEPTDIQAEERPLRGALNITFYWFNRTFRSRQ